MSLQLPPTSLIPEPSTGSTSSTAELYQSYNTNDFIRPGTNVTIDRQGRGSNVSSNSTKKATRTRSYVTVLREQLWKEEKLLRTIHDKVIEELRRLQIEESILQKIILEASQHQDSSLQTSTHLSPSLSHFDSLSASTFTQDHQNMLLPSSSLSTPSESLGFSYEEDQSDYMLGWDALVEWM
ncbi:hypothetical protein BKA69DRAFT_653790 [Paraphysoderma sedebokerense]|nr:hypothetical protein BKA69DRAFT_653790 [Paraphysoderma sedebokerense]